MKTYSATARREASWWVIEVPDVGVTQARSTAEARSMAVDLIAIMLDLPVT